MKRFIALLLACMLIVSLALTGCGKKDDTKEGSKTDGGSSVEEVKDDPNVKVINVYAFTNEVPNMVKKYKEAHPDFPYEIKETIIATTDGLYQPALDQALAAGGADAPALCCPRASRLALSILAAFAGDSTSMRRANSQFNGLLSCRHRVDAWKRR